MVGILTTGGPTQCRLEGCGCHVSEPAHAGWLFPIDEVVCRARGHDPDWHRCQCHRSKYACRFHFGGTVTDGPHCVPAWTPLYVPPAPTHAIMATQAPSTSSRAAAEAKVEDVLRVCATEAERALLFWTLRNGADWTSERARSVLRQAGWWLA